MRMLLKGIKRKMVDILSLDRLSEKNYTLIINYLFLLIHVTLESVFVNTLLFRITNDMSLVILYRGIYYAVVAIAMHLGAYICQKKTPIFIMRLGIILHCSLYIVLTVFLDNIQNVYYFVAILSGMGTAFYWAGHNVLISNYTTRQNRDVSISVLGIVQGIMSLFVPVTAGYVIALVHGNGGYRIMFVIAMLAVITQGIIQSNLVDVVQDRHESKALLALKLILKKRTLKMLMGYELMRGFRDGTFAFVMNMVLFQVITDESLVGINTLLAGILSIIGSWVYGKIMRPSLRAKFVIIATTILLLACVGLYFRMSITTIILFSILNAFFALFITNSCSNCSYDIVGQNLTTRKCMGELFAFRECSLAVGRILGLLILFTVPQNQTGYLWAIIILTASQYLIAILLHISHRMIVRKQEEIDGHTA